VTADLDVLERLMQQRRSERQFLADALPVATIEPLLELAASAPSASNRQPYRYMVVSRRETIGALAATVQETLSCGEATPPNQVAVDDPMRARLGRDFPDYAKHFVAFSTAPLLVVVFFRAENVLRQALAEAAVDDSVTQVREALSSASAFIMQFLLAAHAAGLGACWMTGPCIAEDRLLEALAVPPGWRLAAFIPVGHCATRSPAPRRRSSQRLRLAEPRDGLSTPSSPTNSSGPSSTECPHAFRAG
jgi:nitroreductase